MVGERRTRDWLVPLGPRLWAYPEELLRQRQGHDGHPEYLIRWTVLQRGKEGGVGSGNSLEGKAEHILMWLSAPEVYANCPMLLGERAPAKGPQHEPVGSAGAFPRDAGGLDEASLGEMAADVRGLVRRAARQLDGGGNSSPAASVLHTIHVLSAYASIGPLAGVFRETGALDLLMHMLGNPEPQIRRSAGKMLQALAAHDAGSRAHVLLSLSQQDGIEQHMDFDSRSTLLELFAETTSSEEHCMAFEGIHLPQIPGKLLFSLVKRYLCVTSLLDQLSSSVDPGSGEWGNRCSPNKASVVEKSRGQKELEFSMAMGNLISELVRGMGWDRGPGRQPVSPPRPARSIFQPLSSVPSTILPTLLTPTSPRRPSRAFRPRSEFSSLSGYADYVQETLQPGMRVRMLEDYEEISAGDQGEFRQSNNGMPPVQVLWQSTGHTYWVHWHMVEILGPITEDKVAAEPEKGTRSSGPQAPAPPFLDWKLLGGLYALPYLKPEAQKNTESRCLSQAEWWELLFFIKKLDGPEQQEFLRLLQENLDGEPVEELALSELSIPVELAEKLVLELSRQVQGSTHSDLLSSLVYNKFKPPPKVENLAKGPEPSQDTCSPEVPFPDTKSEGEREGETKSPGLEESSTAPEAELLFRSLVGAAEPSGQLLLELELRLCQEGLGVGQVGQLLGQLQHQPQAFLLLLQSLETPENKALQMTGLRILSCLLERSVDSTLPWHQVASSCLASLRTGSKDFEVVQELVCFLHRLAMSHKDCAVVLYRLGAQEVLTKAQDKHKEPLLLVSELCNLLGEYEKHARLYSDLTESILAGCIQMVLGQIEEHRRTHRPINIPFFDVFLRHLCQGCGVGVEDKCWEKVEVSSNAHGASKLTDGNPKTYWESSGSTGSHYITLYMHHGILVRQLTLMVAKEDSSYMPARVVVLGGDHASSVSTKLSTINVMPSDSRVLLLENMTRFWPILQIHIKRCQQGGIDTRVRGVEVLGPKPTFWPLFREQLCRRTHLFYTVRAQAWSQDIAQDRKRLLQLCPRLNGALRHEQSFADRFLPDDEAAQALGRTCWEALVSPLVQSITAPDGSGVSPLAWLLGQYLEHREKARCPQGRADSFISRVRRLSHLLVHVEPPSGIQSKLLTWPNGKNSKNQALNSETDLGPPGGSMRDITQCWRGVVQEQVSRFLTAAWQAPDLVPRYCDIYEWLQSAGAELFGPRAAFTLALRQGFSGALLQLSFLTAAHVSEQFARHIDQQIQRSRVGGPQGEEMLGQLQRSLEPMMVLSGLELATTFEHFYQYYLADRLLSLGPSWLEQAVLEQIGLCFPNRLPQQMLSSLSTSEELQHQFHLFQLEQIDQQLLEQEDEEQGLEAHSQEEPGKELPEESTPEVSVLVLSPRCWPVSPLCYLHEPNKYLPPALSTSLSQFSNFYIQSQCPPAVGPHRLLQWSWLGRAELLFGTRILHVSTLQMWLLLHFNQVEEMALETLLQTSDLSSELLMQALKPLTSGLGPLTLQEGQGLPPGGVLRLREVEEPGGEALWLLPPQTYLSVEEDECQTLERKRNLLSCLLVRILKAHGEKGLHIDQLVCLVRGRGPCKVVRWALPGAWPPGARGGWIWGTVEHPVGSLVRRRIQRENWGRVTGLCVRPQVLETWQKGQSPPGALDASGAGAGGCSGADVLSCVLHLLGQGYVRRQEDRPQVLAYAAPEPEGPPLAPPNLVPLGPAPLPTFHTLEIRTRTSPGPSPPPRTFSTFR
ncbi:cullin-7 isoform X2 [Macrotis lagotis]|uniref:cullin-7 isoform X2 n=1 Tax=Macrotis lagotis TaxID=92651 RepID=UPI003D68B23F